MTTKLLSKLPSPILITGPAFSGKSSLAQQIMGPREPVTVIGTSTIDSALIKSRIDTLKGQRPGGWQTVDHPSDLAAALATHVQSGQDILLDSFSLWLAHRLVPHAAKLPIEEALVASLITSEIDEVIKIIKKTTEARLVIVTAEAGAGPSPDRATERLFRMILGTTNCRLATLCRSVLDVRCGIPIVLKEA